MNDFSNSNNASKLDFTFTLYLPMACEIIIIVYDSWKRVLHKLKIYKKFKFDAKSLNELDEMINGKQQHYESRLLCVIFNR